MGGRKKLKRMTAPSLKNIVCWTIVTVSPSELEEIDCPKCTEGDRLLSVRVCTNRKLESTGITSKSSLLGGNA